MLALWTWETARAGSRPPKRGERKWALLYRIGGVSVALVVATVLHTGVFFVTGLPTTVIEWYALFARDAFLGLLAFELLPVIYVIFSVPVVLALYVALRRANSSLMALYLGLGAVGIMSFIVARPAFEMLSLGNSYAAATNEAERATLRAAGEAMRFRSSIPVF
jgi:hypothetical protein